MTCSCTVCIPDFVTNAKPKRAVGGFRLDPTRTNAIRSGWERDMAARFKALKWSIDKFIGTEDRFGLTVRKPMTLNTDYQFLTDPNKLKTFIAWLKSQIDRSLLAIGPGETPWTAKYVDSAYKKGAMNAFVATNKKDLGKPADFQKGAQVQFMRDNFSQPEKLSKIQMIATRSFENLKGITGPMSARMNTIMADGMAKGLGPKQIAKEMSKQLDISLNRARTIVRTETIHAHAEGQLDSLEALGVDSVGVLVEWVTAGDGPVAEGGKVCPKCESMAKGSPYTIKQARGKIPVHPNCRCAFIPYVK